MLKCCSPRPRGNDVGAYLFRYSCSSICSHQFGLGAGHLQSLIIVGQLGYQSGIVSDPLRGPNDIFLTYQHTKNELKRLTCCH